MTDRIRVPRTMSPGVLRRAAVFLLVIAVWVSGCDRPVGRSETEAEFWERMETFVTERMNPAGSGFGFIVIHDGAVAFTRGWGMANIETAVPFSSDTPCRTASLTKQFTTVAILILYERDLLTLQTPIVSIFPEFPAAWSAITVHHLLTHQSGIPNYTAITGDSPEAIDGLTNQAALDLVMADPTLDFTPGEQTAYCNTGYLILAMLVERLTGQSFPDFLHDEIFEPLGMSSTFVRHASSVVPSNVAQPYNEQNQRYQYSLYTYGPMGIYTTFNDYFQWDQALYTDQIIRQSTLELAFTGYTGGQDNFGYGWMVGRYDSSPSYRHGGFSTGYLNYVYRVPARQFTYLFFSNGGVFANDGFDTWTSELMDSIFDFYL